jgi:predicted phage-related endonuclease
VDRLPRGEALRDWRQRYRQAARHIELRGPDGRLRREARALAAEDIVAQLFAERTGIAVSPARFLHHAEHRFLLGSPDRILADDGFLEIKVLGLEFYETTMQNGISPDYMAQLQWYMGLGGRSHGWFAVFNAERWSLHTVRVDADPEWFAFAVAEGVRFWNEHVRARVRPSAEPHPALRSMLAAPQGDVVSVAGQAELRNAIERLKGVKAEIKLLERRESLLVEQIKAGMTALDADAIRCPEGTVYWREQGGKRFNAELFRFDHPTIDLDAYRTQEVSRPFRIYAKGE